MKQKKSSKYIVAILLGLLVIGTFVFLFTKSKPAPVKYQELEATVMDISKSTVINGKIIPRKEVDIKPHINGIISELYKEAGQTVQENEVIAKLKVIPDMNSLSSAQSRVRLAEINLAQAKTTFESIVNGYESQGPEDDVLDNVKMRLEKLSQMTNTI